MSKMIRFDHQARLALKAGVDQMAEAVRVTLGPRGRNVLLDRQVGVPIVTNDGVTIVRDIRLPDPYENLGAQLLREVANKTAELAGDGTTTATLLAQAMVSQGLLAVTAGENPLHLKRGIDRAVEAVIGDIKKQARPIKTEGEMARVATLSAHMDRDLGALVARALHKVGSEGIVSIEEAKGTETKLNHVDGLRFDRGYISPYFVNDPERMEVEAENAYVLLYDRKVANVAELLPLLEQVAQVGGPLLILAEDIEGEALATLVMNRLRGSLDAVAVKAPGFGDRRREMLEDIAILTGGQVISADAGDRLESATLGQLGRVERLRVSRDHTTLAGGGGKAKLIKERCVELKRQIEETVSKYDREKLQERLARLSSGVAQIEVGGHSEMEMKEKKGRFEDALAATRAAVEEGVVPGGGVALLRSLGSLDSLKSKTDGERAGVEIVRRALQSPARTIAENAGFEGGTVLQTILGKTGGFGFNAETGEFCDLIEAGVIDPAKVTRLALLHAASIGSLILTTETLVAEKPADGDEQNG
ncbi:MAG: chaperonin GroEL [Candidatus Eisenbacteria bacterium]|nr:chaperonin GroEL [Candidatus Eisenbacteria bacterium]